MNHKTFLVGLIVLFSISIVALVNLGLSASPAGALIPNLLSDHQATSQQSLIQYIDAKPTQNIVHIAWSETVTVTPPDDTDIFYRQLPNGSTINLSDNVQEQGSAGPVLVQPSIGNNVCVLWREETSSGDYYLYLWRSASNTTKISPNPVGPDPEIILSQFVCNLEEDALITWKDSTNEVYLWDETANVQTKLSNDEAGGYISDFQRIDVNDDVYLAWIEPESGVKRVYLWDSINDVAQEIALNGVNNLHLLKDKNDVIYLFWGRQVEFSAPCQYYWTSLTQSIQQLYACGDQILEVTNDKDENVLAAWHKYSGPTPITHWNLTENVTETIEIPNQAIINMNFIIGPDNTSHFFWQDFVTKGLYYWNSKTVSETLVTPASSYLFEQFTWDFDSNGQLHTLWGDSTDEPNFKDVAYWKPSLTSPQTLTESVYVNYSNIGLTVDNQDIVHTLFVGADGKLYYWDNQTDQIKPAVDEYQYISSRLIEMVAFENDDIFGFYQTSGDQYYYWNPQNGQSYLDRMAKPPTPITDNAGKTYVYWITKNMSENENDLYAAWVLDYNHSVYLPMVVK